LQVARANPKTKTCKRACLPKRTVDRKKAAKMKDKLTEKQNNETLTAPICNAAIVGTLKGVTSPKTRQADLDL